MATKMEWVSVKREVISSDDSCEELLQVSPSYETSVVTPSTSTSDMTYTEYSVGQSEYPGVIPINQLAAIKPDQLKLAQATCALPATNNWQGQYGFSLSFGVQEKPTKTTAWTYSEMKDKLFVNMGAACPVRFHTKHLPPPGTILRAMAVFTKPEYVTEVVKRCLTHSSRNEASNENHPAPEHLIRCESSQAYYLVDPTTGRHSVVVPYENPQVGMSFIVYLFRFMCLGSCVGGLNRRPIQIVFTLENDRGLCLGRRALEIRICACPGRDRRNEENLLEKQHEPQQGTVDSVKRTVVRLSQELWNNTPLPKKVKTSSDDDKIFTLEVRGRKNYEYLCIMRDALEKQRYLTSEQLRAYQHDKELHFSKPKKKGNKNSSGEESD
ncbi:cellular tumor antigen p53-like isoform X2 [Limulus polyphemus]|uniref:Cellular tumor antigen p53-like isoform X2 n=1 Tax=Limulus polyphemus TaxID=6850 RepID=A0ABM1B0R5_LIMPO|nr:cellular tumor antigen p53-like isoform X2 [Limulus polyphemus]